MGSIFQNPTLAKSKVATRRQLIYFDTKKTIDKSPNIQHELRLQKSVCHYIKLQYPSIIFRSDTASGRWEYNRQKLNEKVAMHSSRDFPDLFIYEPRKVKHADGTMQHYCGLALEIKKEGTTVILKRGNRKGKLTLDPHIQAQALMLKGLIHKGYYANFGVGFDDCKRIIDWYMGVPQTKEMF